MRKIILLTVNLLFAVGIILGQQAGGSIRGSVRSADGKNVESATVSLYRSQDSSLVKMAVTSKEGVFAIESLEAKSYFLSISAIGFEDYNSGVITLGADKLNMELPAIEMVQASKAMSAVTVTARRPMIEQKIDRTVVNVDASVTSAGGTALDVLEKSPGVTVDKDGNVSLKGKDGVVVYIDGRPSYLSGADLANLLRSMNGSQLDQIEIMTNPPAKYDAAGNSGVINIKTKKTKQFGYSGSITTGYTQTKYARFNESFNMNYRKNKLNLFTNLNFNRFHQGNQLNIDRTFRSPGTGDITSRFSQISRMETLSDYYGGKLGADYAVSKKTTIGGSVSGYYNPSKWKSKTPSYILTPDRDTLQLTNALTGNREKWTNFAGNLNFRTVLDSAGQEISGDFDYIQYLSSNSQPLYSAYFDKSGQPVATPDTLLGQLPQDLFIYSGKIDYSKPLKGGAKFEAGVKATYIETDNNALYENLVNGEKVLDSARTNHFVYKEYIAAGYVNYSRSLGKRWNIQAGLRAENTNTRGVSRGYEYDTEAEEFFASERRFKRSYTQLFPTFYLQFKASEEHSWVLNYGRRVNRPNYSDLNPFINFLDRYTFQEGNPNLKPQFAHNVELSHNYKGFLNTTLNYTQTDDIIQQVFEQNEETTETYLKKANIASMKQVGIAVSTSKQFTKWWSGNVFVNTNYNYFKGVVNNVPVSLDQLTVLVQAQQQFKLGKNWTAELSGMYRSSGLQGVILIKSFGNVNAGISKQVLNNKGTIRLNVRDIFHQNKFNGSSRYGDVDVNFRNTVDSRSFSISFSWRFSKGKVNGQSSRKTSGVGDEVDRVGR